MVWVFPDEYLTVKFKKKKKKKKKKKREVLPNKW